LAKLLDITNVDVPGIHAYIVDDRHELVAPRSWARSITPWYGWMAGDRELDEIANYFERVAVDGIGDNPGEVMEYLRTQKQRGSVFGEI
jgi:hypothetical protein